MKWFRHTRILIFCLFAWSTLVSQDYCDVKYDYVWIMGGVDFDTTHDKYGGHELNFNASPFSVNLHPKLHYVHFQNTSMSSRSGDLIFYSNGCSVINALDLEMVNGDSLNPGKIYDQNCPKLGYLGLQNMIALPSNYQDSVFYLIHVDRRTDDQPNPPILFIAENMYFTKIDMSGDNGLGEVVEKNVVILRDTTMMTTSVTAVRHANGLDWWIINPNRYSNSFNRVLVDENGPRFIDRQYIGLVPDSISTAGQIKFSPDGSMLAWYHPLNGLFLYDFDRDLGTLSNFRKIVIPEFDGITGGCEFSPSGRFLYVNTDTSLFQLDVFEVDIQSSLTHIADFDKFADPFPTSFFFMERTPDHRIIMNVLNGSEWLHIIQEPNKKGTDCRFEQHTLKLPTVNNFTLPHFPNYRLGPLGEPLCDSIWVSATDPWPAGEIRYKLGPVPTSGILYIYPIDASIQYGYEISILDMNGQRILQSNQSEIDLSGLAPGMYMCRISDESGFVQIEKIAAVR